MKLEIQLALSEAALGDARRGAERIDALLAKYGHSRGPVTAAVLHEARARIALLSDNVQAFRRHLEKMGDAARATNNPSLLAQWRRLERKLRVGVGLSSPPEALGDTALPTTSADPSGATGLYEDSDTVAIPNELDPEPDGTGP